LPSAVVLAAIILSAILPACHKSSKAAGGRTFYDSLGGTTLVTDPENFGQTVEKGYLTIRTIVDSALLIIQADTLINDYFSIMVVQDTLHETPTEFDKLSLNITDFLAVAAGAKNFSYSGPDLHAAHDPGSNPNMPARVDSAAFNEFAFDFGQSALRYAGLNYQLISQLGTLLYRYEGQVVQP